MNVIVCLYLLLCSLSCSPIFSETPHLLIKIPTRSRPTQFFKNLDLYYQKISGEVPCKFLISCDSDDLSMNNPEIMERFKQYPDLSVSFNNNNSKVEAYNRDIENNLDFDILLVTSDDLEPVVDSFDKIIVDTMLAAFPDYDGVLNFNDGHVGGECNTMPVIGKKYYQRFNYVYHPAYKSLYCDEELTLVSKILHKENVCNQVIIRHNHPVFGLAAWDALYYRNEQLKSQDQTTFLLRKQHNFYCEAHHQKDWSILICTLEERRESFERIYTKLTQQINSQDLGDRIEVLYFRDNRENSVGFKRNSLLAQSSGEYVCFVDDDDDVHDKYIALIYNKLRKKPDCVSLKGIMTHHGEHRKEFVHSLHYPTYFEQNNVYYRPPNHLNPIKRSIALQFKFPETFHGEDLCWTMALTASGLLKTESTVDEPYYFYLCSDNPLSRYY